MKGTEYCQAVLRELSRPTFGDRICHLCKDSSSFALHLCDNHASLVLNESLPSIVSKVSSLDMKQLELNYIVLVSVYILFFCRHFIFVFPVCIALGLQQNEPIEPTLRSLLFKGTNFCDLEKFAKFKDRKIYATCASDGHPESSR